MGPTLQKRDVTNALRLVVVVYANRQYETREHKTSDTQIAEDNDVHDSDSALFNSFYNEGESVDILKIRNFSPQRFLLYMNK